MAAAPTPLVTPSSAPEASSAPAPGRLVSINKWEFASQIGTVTLNYESDGSPALLGNCQAQVQVQVQVPMSPKPKNLTK